MNWLQLTIEETKKKKEELEAPNLDFVDQRLVEAANTGLGLFKIAKVLEA